MQLSSRGGTYSRALAIHHVSATHPLTHTRLGDTEILRNLRIRQLIQPSDTNNLLTELLWMRPWHDAILPAENEPHRSGVKQTRVSPSDHSNPECMRTTVLPPAPTGTYRT